MVSYHTSAANAAAVLASGGGEAAEPDDCSLFTLASPRVLPGPVTFGLRGFFGLDAAAGVCAFVLDKVAGAEPSTRPGGAVEVLVSLPQRLPISN